MTELVQRHQQLQMARFRALEAGRYTVVVTGPGLVSDAQSVAIGTTPVQLDITLRLSALNETLVVSASQVDQPLSRTPDSVTVIDAAGKRAWSNPIWWDELG